MKLKEIGEFGFIERFSGSFKDLVTKNLTGIGDDCAILPMNEQEDLLVTTDLLMEDVHFLRSAITPGQLGYKSVAVNLSDIASMGGTPIGTFLSIAIPPDMDVEYLDELMAGYHAISQKYNVPLLGGDTTKSVKHLAINVCVLGTIEKGKARLRSMAQTGDAICVTGNLGDSAGGLKVLLDGLEKTGDYACLLQRHHLPEPRIPEGNLLKEFEGVHAMMDISDGIASDLKHILKASGKSARVNLDQLPVSDELKRACLNQGWSSEELASGGGEDYELLFTVTAEKLGALKKAYEEQFQKPLYVIGQIEEGEAQIQWLRNGETVEFRKGGFNHFG